MAMSSILGVGIYQPRIIACGRLRVIPGTVQIVNEVGIAPDSSTSRFSQAFFRVDALLLRVRFLHGDLLALVAWEFIRTALVEKWLPMLAAFRLMLVFTLLDPTKIAVGSLFQAMGHPEIPLQARLVQLVLLVTGLSLMGALRGIASVAFAVDLMLVTGMILLFSQSRAFAGSSQRALFTAPISGLLLPMPTALAAGSIPVLAGSDWWTGATKAVALSDVYVLIPLRPERYHVLAMPQLLVKYLLGR